MECVLCGDTKPLDRRGVCVWRIGCEHRCRQLAAIEAELQAIIAAEQEHDSQVFNWAAPDTEWADDANWVAAPTQAHWSDAVPAGWAWAEHYCSSGHLHHYVQPPGADDWYQADTDEQLGLAVWQATHGRNPGS